MKTNWKQQLNRMLYICVALSLPLVIIFSATLFYAYNWQFYKDAFRRYDLDQQVGIQMDEMDQVARELIAYIEGDRSDLDHVNVQIDGEMQSFFNAREKAHMADVLKLFRITENMRNYVAIFILLSALSMKLKNEDVVFLKAIGAGSLLTLLMCGLVIAFSKLDFNQYFTMFHELTFDNDLWLLNPDTDRLIRMLPLAFFIDIVTRIITGSSIVALAGTLAGFWGARKMSMKETEV